MNAEMKVVFAVNRIAAELDERMVKPLVTDIASTYARTVKDIMRTSPASGRWYKSRRTKNVMHQASAPGEPPAPDTGQLMGSIGFVVRKTMFGWVGDVGSSLKTAKYLEFGAARGTKGSTGRIESVQWILFPRPAWGPALQMIRYWMPQFIAKARTRFKGR